MFGGDLDVQTFDGDRKYLVPRTFSSPFSCSNLHDMTNFEVGVQLPEWRLTVHLYEGRKVWGIYILYLVGKLTILVFRPVDYISAQEPY